MYFLLNKQIIIINKVGSFPSFFASEMYIKYVDLKLKLLTWNNIEISNVEPYIINALFKLGVIMFHLVLVLI
jgi:hypothetical protein